MINLCDSGTIDKIDPLRRYMYRHFDLNSSVIEQMTPLEKIDTIFLIQTSFETCRNELPHSFIDFHKKIART